MWSGNGDEAAGHPHMYPPPHVQMGYAVPMQNGRPVAGPSPMQQQLQQQQQMQQIQQQQRVVPQQAQYNPRAVPPAMMWQQDQMTTMPPHGAHQQYHNPPPPQHPQQQQQYWDGGMQQQPPPQQPTAPWQPQGNWAPMMMANGQMTMTQHPPPQMQQQPQGYWSPEQVAAPPGGFARADLPMYQQPPPPQTWTNGEPNGKIMNGYRGQPQQSQRGEWRGNNPHHSHHGGGGHQAQQQPPQHMEGRWSNNGGMPAQGHHGHEQGGRGGPSDSHRREDGAHGPQSSNSRHGNSAPFHGNPAAMWNPEEAIAEQQSNGDMVWRDPNPKQKKVQRDIGTSIWGDPQAQRSINNWMRPENAPSDFDWCTAVSGGSSSASQHQQQLGLGWNDPIPGDRPARSTADIERNVLQQAVHRGILSAAVLTKPLGESSIFELNELLRVMAKRDQLQQEKERLTSTPHGNNMHQVSMVASLDLDIQQATADLERLKASIESGDASVGSKLQQWKRACPTEEATMEQIVKATNNMNIRSMNEEWLESSNHVGENGDEGGPVAGPPAFVPGKPWTWRDDPNKIAQDPNITPGQIKLGHLALLKATAENEEQNQYPQWSNADGEPVSIANDLVVSFPHAGQGQRIYQYCRALGNVPLFHVNDENVFVKWMSNEMTMQMLEVLKGQLPPQMMNNVRILNEEEANLELGA